MSNNASRSSEFRTEPPPPNDIDIYDNLPPRLRQVVANYPIILVSASVQRSLQYAGEARTLQMLKDKAARMPRSFVEDPKAMERR